MDNFKGLTDDIDSIGIEGGIINEKTDIEKTIKSPAFEKKDVLITDVFQNKK